MQILGRVILQEAARKHADASNAIAMWQVSVAAAKWSSLVELKAGIPSADYIRPFTVFNIRGNKYRLIAHFEYAVQVVVVRNFLTHAEYDKEAWK